MYEIEIQGCGWGVVNGTNIHFQLYIAYLNSEIFERGSDNRGWTVVHFFKHKNDTCTHTHRAHHQLNTISLPLPLTTPLKAPPILVT